MAKRRKKRLTHLFVLALLALVGFEVVQSLSTQLPVLANAEANLAQAAASRRAQCTGGQVFVFSTDFANADVKNTKRPIRFTQFSCPGGNSLRFLENLSLTPAAACKYLPVQRSDAPSCVSVYYAVVWNGPAAGTALTEDTMNGTFKLESRVCKHVPYNGQVDESADCAAVAEAMKKQYNKPLNPGTVYVGMKTPEVIPSIRSYNPSMLEKIQMGLRNGDVIVRPHAGFGTDSQGTIEGSTGSLPNNQRTWGIQFIFPINPR